MMVDVVLDVAVASNDDRVLAANLLRSPMLGRSDVSLRICRGFASASLAYVDAVVQSRSDLIVLVHQDAYLPAGWEDALLRQVAALQTNDPDWAVLGVYGVTSTGAHVGSIWSSGLDALFGEPFCSPVPVTCIDEVLLVLRRSSGVQFDPALPGFHLYATDLVQCALSLGKGAYVIHAPIVHNSRPALYLGADYFEAYRYMARKWAHRLPIQSHIAPIVGPGLSYLRLRGRHRLNEWRHARIDRDALSRHYDCVGIARRLGFE